MLPNRKEDRGYQWWSAGVEGEILLALFEVDSIVVLYLLHLFQLCLFYVSHLLHVELAPSVIAVEVLFRTVALVDIM